MRPRKGRDGRNKKVQAASLNRRRDGISFSRFQRSCITNNNVGSLIQAVNRRLSQRYVSFLSDQCREHIPQIKSHRKNGVQRVQSVSSLTLATQDHWDTLHPPYCPRLPLFRTRDMKQ
jgi:hypothetical protein